ncbi:SlyX family protein [Ferrimonas balearica]|nr:SlyX family protein [Ferrimonas balearica]
MELETKIAYQDSTIEQLNETVVELSAKVHKQAEQIRLLAERLKSLPNSSVADLSEETPPPHY